MTKLILLTSLTALFACQEETKTPPPTPAPATKIHFTNELFPHKIHDESCQKESPKAIIGGVQAYLLQEDLGLQLTPAPKMTATTLGMSTAAVRATTYGLELFQEYLPSGVSLPMRTTQNPKPLKICRSQAFPQRTYEAALATTVTLLNNARESYVTLAGAKEIPPSNLHIFPKISVSRGSEDENNHNNIKARIIADNAAFSYSNGRSHFYIFPRSLEALEADFFADFDLWESPFVMNHEFGHLVFDSYFYDEGPAHHTLYKECFKRQHFPKDSSEFMGSNDIMSAFNEAFADLLSQYLQDREPSTELEGHTCLEKTRSIVSPDFNDGRLKELTEYNLTEFTLNLSSSTLSCQTTDLSDVHHMGAIIAHSFHFMLSTQDLTNRVKAEVLLQWLTIISQEKHSLQTGTQEAITRKVYGYFITAIKEKTPLTMDHCEAFKTKAPFIYHSNLCEELIN